MTPTSATCPTSKPPLRHTSRNGFTLLELVVVLALLALATALVAPSGFRMIASWRRTTEVDASLQAITALSSTAAQDGRARTLEAGPVAAGSLPGLPESWQVELDAPLAVQANGACGDSRGRVRGPDGYEQPFKVSAPFCRTQRADAGQ
ncbi:prepilin-type N-terminal cleavage/methylation domain-containing protein [Stenotrophomonas sp. PS02297]|uniref:prepilin-type N-terminal cleavage/methylation domain-containing protein n=1 Tax=Stenotrophomonas sp. PS02297 TaxID=2991423 RepID=UPI00249C7691|nr:prepilin-type N-terminal cleavage/methylation domain-containing protein [Stenotrophomonas sp. PS02297]